MTETTKHTHPAGARCPICSRPASPDLRPFCSKRCADVDLSRWLGEVYRVETPEPAPGIARPDEED
ncbi:DNA gyrase inhibitor YacG [Azospirillum sp. SYSU D00513]|uniref:DNA gyrase inhibitor YacG n=1 Tax=Azospirillum sp. SYSU D00513 TaxID=2812561 RepID=UPI001A97AB7E|nr:DNA gyrase inhibitor YacG [Azospirillum sp. SYSU D00513]